MTTGRIRRFLGDAEYEFKICIGEAEELQEIFDCGLMQMLARVADLDVRAIKHTLRVGLVGGGDMDKERAARFVERHLTAGHFMTCAQVASVALEAAIHGQKDSDDIPGAGLGEPQGAKADAPCPTDESATAPSTPTDRPPG